MLLLSFNWNVTEPSLTVPLPVTATVHEILTRLIDDGFGDQDFASLIELEARASGLTLEPEHVDVDDGLSPIDDVARQADEARR